MAYVGRSGKSKYMASAYDCISGSGSVDGSGREWKSDRRSTAIPWFAGAVFLYCVSGGAKQEG